MSDQLDTLNVKKLAVYPEKQVPGFTQLLSALKDFDVTGTYPMRVESVV